MNVLKFINTLTETDPEMARREYITRSVLLFLFGVTLSFTLLSLVLYFFGKMPLDTLLLYSATSIALIVAMFLARAGFWRAAGIVPPLLMYFPAVNANYIGGIDAPGNFLYALLIMLVAIIYGHRKMWIALAICLATYLGMAWMIASGHIKPFRTAEVVFASRVVLTSGFLVGIALLIWILGRNYRSEIDVRTKAEEQLSRRNEELAALNESLRQSEELYAKLIAAVPDIILRMNLNGDVIFVNDVGLTLSGYRSTELIGQNMLSFIAPEDQEKAVRNTFLMFERRLGPQEYHLIMKDGRKLLFEVNGDVLRNKDGSPYGIVQVCRDITERKRAEDALKESEASYRQLFENSPAGIYRVDFRNGKFVRVNDVFRQYLGYSPEEIASMSPYDLLTEESKKLFVDRLGKMARGEAIPETVEYEIVDKEGKRRCVRLQNRNIYDGEGRVVASDVVAHEITELKRAEQEKRTLEERLQRAEKMEALGQLAGGVAHDLNNVLGILSGYSELLLMEIPEGSRSRGHLEKILQSTEKGAAIIQDLLTLARRGVTVSDVINLNGVVSGFLKTPVFEKMKDHHPHVTFKVACDEKLLNIKGSAVHLEKTLMNLVSNAAESISGPGEVTIRTESRYLDKAIQGYDEVTEGDYAVLTVSDTGAGIPGEHRDKIFEPFYTKKKMGRSGTGLGLTIVWGTVKDHNGYIDLRTEEGKGTIFTLYFPVTREESTAPREKEPMERYRGNGEFVLVVDDVPEQRDVASGLLAQLGYKVHAVPGGEEAVAYLKENRADILVLDMIMAPGIDGLETYERVLEVNPKQKAILVSGFSETDRVRKAQKLGAGAYVKKPYIMEGIGVAIRDELKR